MTVIATDDGLGPNNLIENEVIDLGPETDLETLEIDAAIEKNSDQLLQFRGWARLYFGASAAFTRL